MESNPPKTNAELEKRLDQLVREAYKNGVMVADRSYVLRHDAATLPDWELTILKLADPAG